MSEYECITGKAKKWCSEHSNKSCTEQCDGCWQLKQAWGCEQHDMETAYKAGANYVLDAIEEATNICFDEEIMRAIKQLKGNQQIAEYEE